ncbi:MAG: right-handed parallel beta-helix repeat-containing protein [Planctomycetes bacterium]|nr:right-handed parallel beta-helix repeat-containing protein [Planctomycetota bacterium]
MGSHSVSTIPYSKARRALLPYQAPGALAIIPDAGGDAGEPRGGATLVVDDDLDCANATYSTITAAIAAAANGDTVEVCAGTYNEDVEINKSITLISRDGAAATIISGPIGGTGAITVRIIASDVTVAGFTITRDGNNTTDWNNASLNSPGVAVQGLSITGLILRDNIITGNRSGIDINNSGSHTIRNNQIIFNHTGMILRNQTDDMTIVENEIVNNRTVGILFLDASSGTNVPVQTALSCIISNNSIVGNWYGGIVDRQSGGSLPTPGSNLKNFSGNTFGTTSPVITTANSAEPDYALHIPVEYGGTATNPGGAPDVAGPASANFDITPMLTLSGDTDVETSLGNGTFGFQGDLSNLTVTSEGAQDGLSGRIQEGVDSVSGSEVHVLAGTYAEQVYIDSPVELYGAQAGVDARTRVAASESIIVPDISSPDPDAGFFISLIYVDASDVIIDGFTIDGDNPFLTSAVDYNGANIDAEDGISGFETGYDNITVTNNIIKNLSYTGIDFYPSGTVACTGNSITQNRVENLGGDFGDIGILIYNDFYASVDDNLVVDTSVGIQTGNFHLAGSPSSISDNEVAARDVGVFYNLHYQNASDFVVADNDISAVTNIYSPGSSTWVGAILWSQASAVSVAFTDNVIDGSASNNSATWGFSIWNLPTTVTPTITGGSISGVDLGAYIRNFHPTWLSGPVDVEFHGVDIQADDLGLWIHDHPSNANNDPSSATVTDNCSISTSPTGTGIKVEGADASASITDNNASIFGNLIGIDVDGGSAAISGNHISDNGTGVRSTNGGVITTLDANDFDDIDDNGTDLRMDASAGSVTIGAGNSFAGDDYYIDQRATASHDLTGANSQNYDESDNFRIEDRMYHKLDATASGRVTWVSANRHVSAPGTGDNDETIQRAIDAGDAGDTVNIESGTFVEVFNINKVGMKVVGQGAGSTTIDYTGLGIAPGGVNGAIYSSQNEVELHDLSLTRSDADSLPRYGVKFDFASDMVVEGVAISNSYRTGLDLHGVLDVTVDGVSCTNNGGAGIFLTDVKGAALSNITTSGNPWVGVSVATSGQYTTLGTNGIVFSGTNSFGESAGDNGGLQLEMFDWTLNVPYPISWSANPADNADVTIQPADFAYALTAGAFDDPTHVWVRFHQSLAEAESAAAGNADHLVAGTRYIQEADDSNGLPNSGASDLYVIDTAGDTMSIQAAIEGSSSFHVDTIHIGDGSYPENIDASANAVILSPGQSRNHGACRQHGTDRRRFVVDRGQWAYARHIT